MSTTTFDMASRMLSRCGPNRLIVVQRIGCPSSGHHMKGATDVTCFAQYLHIRQGAIVNIDKYDI
jgi:hypothetical protein